MFKPRQINIASLNLASSNRDEKSHPLADRLSCIEALFEKTKHAYDICCLQEVRATKDLSAFDVILRIRQALGSNWEFHDQTVNTSCNTFHRTIFWDANKWRHHNTHAVYTNDKPVLVPVAGTCMFYERKRQNYFPYLLTQSWFSRVGSKSHIPDINVLNVHAPMLLEDRIEYWKCVNHLMDPFSIAIGDFNKFDDDRVLFNQIFRFPIVDLVSPTTETFVSFSNDRKPSLVEGENGELWRSSLDGVLVNATKQNGLVRVISTEEPPRASDHFLIITSVIDLFSLLQSVELIREPVK